jgi:hypothetical protein
MIASHHLKKNLKANGKISMNSISQIVSDGKAACQHFIKADFVGEISEQKKTCIGSYVSALEIKFEIIVEIRMHIG